jgi:hypothetical protein
MPRGDEYSVIDRAAFARAAVAMVADSSQASQEGPATDTVSPSNPGGESRHFGAGMFLASNGRP